MGMDVLPAMLILMILLVFGIIYIAIKVREDFAAGRKQMAVFGILGALGTPALIALVILTAY